jgi:dUTP pyrophosphatase
MNINVKLDEGAYLPDRAHATDAGADLKTPRDVHIPPHGSAVIDTGVHVELPHGYAGFLKSKSGLNVKHGIVSEGVIDEGYTGSIVAKLYNHGGENVHLARGTKVTQLVVMPVEYVGFEQVDEISGGERGDAGFGSTDDI